MNNKHSTTSERPAKPYPGFPLFPMGNGQWAKKINGKSYYFGPWADPHAALQKFLAQEADLRAGRKPKVAAGIPDTLTIEEMVIEFLEAKRLKVTSGQMAPATWKEYEAYGKRMMKVLGADTPVETLGPTHFQKLREHFQKTHKTLVSIKGDIRKIKVFFNWAGSGPKGQGLIEKLPLFGDLFVATSRDELARERESKRDCVFENPADIRKLLDHAPPKLKAMILLGINCGFGNTDCAQFVVGRRCNLTTGWVTCPRAKNANPRRCPLWPETIAALKEAIATRPAAASPEYGKHIFLTHRGQPFTSASISSEFDKLAIKAGLETKKVTPRATKQAKTKPPKRYHKPGKVRIEQIRAESNFYDLRRTCVSIGIQMSDDDAVRAITGHMRPGDDTLGLYNRLRVEDARILRVSNHIRQWLFTGSATPLAHA